MGLAIPAPPPGVYTFRIRRVGAQFDFYLDGELFASLPDVRGHPTDGVSFYFSSPYPGPAGPFHIDRVRLDSICYACDDSGSLDFFDFLCFQNAFAVGGGYADCDGSGSLNFFDFLCFQDAFAMGCP